MWTLQTYSKQKFHLTDSQKEVYLKAIGNGAKLVNFGEFILSDNFEYLVSDNHLKIESLKANPILNDPDFAKFVNTGVGSATLDSRYPFNKYAKEWDEANKNKDYLKSLEK